MENDCSRKPLGNRPDIPCATWNVHRAVGRDRRFSPDRVLAAVEQVILPHAPRVLALQEADADDPPHMALFDRARLSDATGLKSVHDTGDMRWGRQSGGYLGNILMLDPSIAITSRRIVRLPGGVPRAAIIVETLTDGMPLRFVSCHLSLTQILRVLQMRRIGHVLARSARMQTIFLGDLNEWRSWGGLAFWSVATGLSVSGPSVRTFPSHRPLLPLDRILTDHGGQVRDARALDAPEARDASDHLPLFGWASRAPEAVG